MIGYIIQCYSNLAHVPTLISWIWHPDNTYIISRNPRSPDDFDIRGAVAHLTNVHVVDSTPITWGGESLMVAMLDGITALLDRSQTWEYAINIDESCFSLRSQTELFDLLKQQAQLGITEFVSHFGPVQPLDWSNYPRTSAYQSILRARADTDFRSDSALEEHFSDVFGSPIVEHRARASVHTLEGAPGVVYCRPLHRCEQRARAAFFARSPLYLGRIWFCLSRATARWLVDSPEAAIGFEVMKSIFIPDECFVQTMVLGADAPVPREQVSNTDPIWFMSGESTSIDDAMLGELKRSNAFFARPWNAAANPLIAEHIETFAAAQRANMLRILTGASRVHVRKYVELSQAFEQHIIDSETKIKSRKPFYFDGFIKDPQQAYRYFYPEDYHVPELRLDATNDVIAAGAGFIFRPDGTAAAGGVMAGADEQLFTAPWNDLGLTMRGPNDFSVSNLENSIDIPDGYLISSPAPGTYHHLIVDMLPRLFGLIDEGSRNFIAEQGADPDTVPIVVNGRTEIVAEAIAQLGLPISPDRLRLIPDNGCVVIRKAIIPHYLNRFNSWISPRLMEFYRKSLSFSGVTDTVSPFGEKIYHLRRDVPNDRRAIRNVAAIAEMLEKEGFREIEPGRMSIRDEMLAFSQARYIVGAMGSNLANAVFCGPESRILSIQSDASPFALTAFIGAAGGFDTGYVFGRSFPETGHGEQVQFEMDLDQVRAALDNLLRAD